MKKRFLLVVLVNVLIFHCSFSQNGDIKALEKGIYMVIGSFQNKANAISFKEKVSKGGRKASIVFSDQTNFYYVYVKTYQSVDEAVSQVSSMRATTPFDDAWVLAYSTESGMTAMSTSPSNYQPNNDNTDNVTNATSPTTEPKVITSAIVTSESGEKPEALKPKPVDVTKYSPERFITDKKQYKMIFNTYNAVTKTKVNGSINIIDPDRLKLVRAVRAHELEYVNEPHNQSNSLEFISEIFGYKKTQHNLALSKEIKGASDAFLRVQGDTLLVDFPLVRYEKGDVATMYNVFFYKDAAIMKPESQFEINSLLEMLKERPEYKIQISGHTNGNSRGKIIEIDSDVPEYFSLSQATKEGGGSAKKLSLRRAEIIKKYLVNNGISEDRMEVIGYGGKKPIYEKFDRLASKNVRVEIEILQD